MQTKDILRIKGNVLYTVTPESLLAHALGLLVDNDIGSLVVLERGKLIGMLTFREVLRAMHENKAAAGGMKVREVMVRPEVVRPDTEVDELRRVMLEKHTRYVPVMDGENLLGVLSFHDVARAMLEEQAFENRMLKGYIKNWPA